MIMSIARCILCIYIYSKTIAVQGDPPRVYTSKALLSG